MSTPLLQLRGVTKTFPGVAALASVELDLQAGEVHALVGENGAGKSTLIKIVSGVHQPDAGSLSFFGRPVVLPNPRAARELGVAVMYQEAALFPDLSVLENLYVGTYRRRGWRLDWPRMRREAGEMFQSLGVELQLDTLVNRLSAAQQQMVAIARALMQQARVLVMDEPTAPLTQGDVQRLFQLIGQLKARGVGIIYISHRLEEVFQVADRVTVLRDGRRVFSGAVRDVGRDDLIREMVGRTLGALFPKVPGEIGAPLLEVDGLNKSGVLHDVALSVHSGEIVGLAGLVGSGRTTFAHAIFGIDPPDHGRIRIRGQEVKMTHPERARALGLAYVPEDRQRQGLVLPFAVRENLSLVILRQLCRMGFVDPAAEDAVAQQFVARLDIRTPATDVPTLTLSGGNQQKVVVGKWLASEPTVLIMDEPTRGIDVGAKAEIHRLMDALAHRGMGILLISSELPELLGMCDRVLVMHRGRIAGELPRAHATQETIMAIATGVVTKGAEAM